MNKSSDFIDLSVNVAEGREDTSQMQIVRIYYRVNQTTIDRNYMDNNRILELLDRIFSIRPAEEIAYIVIRGSASPEGPFRNNDNLSDQRTKSLKSYILTNYPQIRNDQIVTISTGEDWNGLELMIEDDSKVPYRDNLLRILRSGLSREEQKRRMITLGGGQSYDYLQKHILPKLRGGVSSMIYFKDRFVTFVDTVEIVRVDTVYLERIVYRSKREERRQMNERNSFLIAIKTNLLYDMAFLPNLSLEIPLGRNYAWSVVAEGNWSWWDTGADKYNYHRIQMAGVELRRWFNKHKIKPLTGWYVGVYGYVGDYDVRLFADKNSDIGQQSLLSYSAGVSMGYSVPIGRKLNLEFGLGAGYFGGEYKKYNVSNCVDGVFPVEGVYHRNYFGVTKAGVSLVWLIGNGKNRSNKEGEVKW